VHRYSRDAPSFDTANAIVEILIDRQLADTFYVSRAAGDPARRVWRVFNITSTPTDR